MKDGKYTLRTEAQIIKMGYELSEGWYYKGQNAPINHLFLIEYGGSVIEVSGNAWENKRAGWFYLVDEDMFLSADEVVDRILTKYNEGNSR